MQLDDFNKNNKPSNENEDETVIVNPNLKKKNSVVENAARAGFRETPQPDAGTQRQVDLVNDLGLKTQQQVAAEKAFEEDDISQALGPQLEAAAERRKTEYEQFKDALDQCGGEMTEEDLNMITEQADYKSMLLNPPDPLNSKVREYNKQQLERFKETASEEELKAMGLSNDTDTNEQRDSTAEAANNYVDINEYRKAKEDEEDEDIMNDSEELVIPEVPANIAAALNNVDTSRKPDEDAQDDIIPIAPSPAVEGHLEPDEVTEEQYQYYAAPQIPKTNTSLNSDIDIDKELESLEFDEDFIDAERKEKNKERIKKASDDVRQKIIPIANKMDISGFVISNKPISLNNSVEMAKAVMPQGSARWALFASKRPIIMSGLFGYEIDELSRYWRTNSSSLSVSDVYKKYTYLYNHTLSPKPATVEEWLKTISFIDVKHLYGTAYKASFEKTNFLPVDCDNPDCENGFITDNLPFEEIVKYEDAEAKEKAMAIYNSEPPASEYGLYHTEVLPVSDVYAMSFKDPSIYDVEVAPKYLEDEWYQKMKDTVAFNMYIDKVFVIDPSSNSLRPLAIKEYRNDPKKTLKAKVLALARILPTLTSDQYNLISSYIETINKPVNLVNYQMPTVVCPECGTKIEAQTSYVQEILFTRHRLTALVNG